MTSPSIRELFTLSVPVILANSATPLLGLVDTAVLGQTGDAASLGAIALASLLFNFLYWGVGFLRMSTSGFVAQAVGAEDPVEEAAVLFRAAVIALLIGGSFVILQIPLCQGALALFGGTAQVEQGVAQYFSIRIWGAPASLLLFVWLGYFIGRGETRLLLWLQLLLNGCNIVLDVVFAGVLGWGVSGIALGTLISSWLTSVVAAVLIFRRLSRNGTLNIPLIKAALADKEKRRQSLSANGDILVRTLFMLSGFAVFNDQSARFGNIALAANHILLQLVSFSAFFLDGYAHVTESVVGRAWGASNRRLFEETVRKSTILAAITAAGLALFFYSSGGWLLPLLAKSVKVQSQALAYLPFAVAYIACSFAAFQLDGIFIGTTQTRFLRNASIISTLAFLALCAAMTWGWGMTGLWLSFVGFVIARALSLFRVYPQVLARISLSVPEKEHQTS
jgi:MATE family multidrug resistance protein